MVIVLNSHSYVYDVVLYVVHKAVCLQSRLLAPSYLMLIALFFTQTKRPKLSTTGGALYYAS